MKIKKPLILGVVASIALSTFAAVTPAFADPVSDSFVLVGSDTLQDSANALANGTKTTGTTVRVIANSTNLGSFDAFGSSLIQTKPAGPYFTRPSGSGAGLKALSASIQGNTDPNGSTGKNIAGQVDIARSSSAWGSGKADPTNGKLLYVPFGRDAVTYAYRGSDAALGHLTVAQLTQIYSSNDPVVIGGVTVKPLLPQDQSGTRKFFMGAIAVSNTAPGSQVVSSASIAENDASVLSEDGQIIPFSAASWVAQSNNVAPSTMNANVKLGTPLTEAAVTGSGSSLAANSAYYSDPTWGRETYLIVEYDRVDPSAAKYDAGLAWLMNPANAKSLANYGAASGTAGAVKTRFGFLAPSSTTPTRAYATLP